MEIDRIKELVDILNRASKAYYMEDAEIMANIEYDKLYDELVELEKKTGVILSNSPTQYVGYEVLSELTKEAHIEPMLSLDKTKESAALADFLGNQKGLLSWKMDGLTVVLTYREGKLYKAVTRGNGEIGEVITNNAKTFKNIPSTIPYTGELVVRGEAVIKYSDFNKINASISDVDARYKNPRNLCSGSVRQLNNEITAKRNVHFFAFSLTKADGIDFKNSNEEKFIWLRSMGFEVVEYKTVDKTNIIDTIAYFANAIENNDFPSDGLVLLYDDIAYGKSLGITAKYPRNAMAYKWADELATTTLNYVLWSPSRTGLINPVAVFDPVELEGTTVSKASLHNISILESLALGEGDSITVYKANMIIPQVSENLTRSGTLSIPDTCPACGAATRINDLNGVRTLYCTNELCSAKKIKLFTNFVSRNAMNIDGLSEATLEKFIEEGWLDKLYDLYRLEPYRMQIVMLDGFGEKSYDNLMSSINVSRHTSVARFLFALGILNVGAATAKLIAKHFNDDFMAIREATLEELKNIDGVGEIIAKSIIDYFANSNNKYVVDELLKEITMDKPVEDDTVKVLEGKVFVITGSLNSYENRDALKAEIERLGGKVTGKISKNTNYLINNDINSSSSKNKDAKKMDVPIITEEDFINLINK